MQFIAFKLVVNAFSANLEIRHTVLYGLQNLL